MDQIKEIAITARRSLEPGMPNEAGRVRSNGTCLYASYVLQMMLNKFSDSPAIIKGGDGQGDGGVLGTDGKWHGHYWVEGKTFGGKMFIADITADQFGYDAVVVLAKREGMTRYRPGAQDVVDAAVVDISLMNGRDA